MVRYDKEMPAECARSGLLCEPPYGGATPLFEAVVTMPGVSTQCPASVAVPSRLSLPSVRHSTTRARCDSSLLRFAPLSIVRGGERSSALPRDLSLEVFWV
jgi:hypothetical protein